MKMIKDSKLLLKVFSGFIAVVLWFAVTYTEDPSINQHLGRLDTVFYNEDQLAERGLMVVNKDELPSLSVTIRGKRSKVISALEKVSASIDVKGINSAGEHEVDVEYNYPISDVMLSRQKHSTVTVTVEKLVTKEVPVKITARPNKRDKSHLIESSFTDTVTISGAKSIVSKISYAGFSVNEADITSNGKISYTYELFDSDGNIMKEDNIYSKSHESIPVTHTIYNKTELPVKVVLSEDLSDDYVIEIKEQDVSKITAGVLGKTDVDSLEAVFESKHLENEGDSLTLKITAPDGVYIPKENQKVKIEYKILKKSEINKQENN